MASFLNQPRTLRGAFFEFGLSIPQLFVVFQFNPLQLTRNRSLSYAAPNEVVICPPLGETEEEKKIRTIERQTSLRNFHLGKDLGDIQKNQRVNIQEESIGFEIRLDATDKLNDGDPIAERFGIAPELATLELLVHPKSESLLGGLVDQLPGLGDSGGFSFTKTDKPPMILFIWGHKRVLPVNINSLNITETEFSTMLDPIRATVSVNLTVIEGKNIPYLYTKALKEAASVLNLANAADIANVVIPG